jgi:predicted N-formylglutamate amidohydrolase
MNLRPLTVLLSCEHGGNKVPAEYRRLFAAHHELLQTHRGWDPGTKQLAERWQSELNCELHVATVTRLLVDLNRSPNHRSVFSEITRELSTEEKQKLLATYHTPHRRRVIESVKRVIDSGRRVLHVGVHSFTPELNGEVRNADVSLLYDPASKWESELSHRWREALRASKLEPRVRLNYPYRGNTDGLTTTLRKLTPPATYAGIEIEVNQAIPLAGGSLWRDYQATCIASLTTVLAEHRS